MDEFLKQAFEEGKQRAASELDQKIKDAVKKREAMVGWKEHAQPPARLSGVGK
jgi:hypothetical protein